jgi:hypothetical protein
MMEKNEKIPSGRVQESVYRLGALFTEYDNTPALHEAREGECRM